MPLSSIFCLSCGYKRNWFFAIATQFSEIFCVATGFLPGIFSGGGAKSIVMQISFVMPIFLLFSDQISGRQKSLRGANCLRGAPPAPRGGKPGHRPEELQAGYTVCRKNLPTEKLPEYSEFLIFLQFFGSCCIASARHTTHNFVVRQQHNNFLKLHYHCE